MRVKVDTRDVGGRRRGERGGREKEKGGRKRGGKEEGRKEREIDTM